MAVRAGGVEPRFELASPSPLAILPPPLQASADGNGIDFGQGTVTPLGLHYVQSVSLRSGSNLV